MLQFARDVTRTGEYTTKITGRKIRKYDKHLHHLKVEVNKGFFKRGNDSYKSSEPTKQLLNSFIMSQTGRGATTSMLFLDADSEHAKEQILWDLERRDIPWCVYGSSPEHFWIFVDKFGWTSSMLKIAHEIPGVDPEYLKVVKDRGYFTVRAYPRVGMIPQFVERSEHTGSVRFNTWLKEFQSYWETDDMEWVCSQLFLDAL